MIKLYMLVLIVVTHAPGVTNPFDWHYKPEAIDARRLYSLEECTELRETYHKAGEIPSIFEEQAAVAKALALLIGNVAEKPHVTCVPAAGIQEDS